MKLKLQGPSLSKAPLYAESSLKCSRLRGEVRLQSEHSYVSFSDKLPKRFQKKETQRAMIPGICCDSFLSF